MMLEQRPKVGKKVNCGKGGWGYIPGVWNSLFRSPEVVLHLAFWRKVGGK